MSIHKTGVFGTDENVHDGQCLWLVPTTTRTNQNIEVIRMDQRLGDGQFVSTTRGTLECRRIRYSSGQARASSPGCVPPTEAKQPKLYLEPKHSLGLVCQVCARYGLDHSFAMGSTTRAIQNCL